jgi:hypothetical protein
MAEAAVTSGKRIVVAATLTSTVAPTVDLIRDAARRAGRAVDLLEVVCAEAWAFFQIGDMPAYAEAIAEAVSGRVDGDDIVVLAQASMAPAVEALRLRGIDALASPDAGVRAAFAEYRRLTAR